MIGRIRAGSSDARRIWNTNPFILPAIVITGLVLASVVGCGVLGDPNPCDRTQAMRNALEEGTGRDCDLITDDDLAGVQRLHLVLSSDEARNLKKSDFSGLDDVETLDFAGGGTSRYHARDANVLTGTLHPHIFEYMSSLPSVSNLIFARVASSRGSYYETDSIIVNYFHSRCFGPDLAMATPEWFSNLENLTKITICTVEEIPSHVSVALKERGVMLNPISECSFSESNGRRCDH